MEQREIPRIVRGQRVTEDQKNRAKRLRQEMTPTETQLWQYLRANRLNGLHFRRQQPIGSYFVDFYCHQAGVVIEIDGAIHVQQQEYDAIRDEYLSAYGLLVMRFTNDEVALQLVDVLKRITEACQRRLRDFETGS